MNPFTRADQSDAFKKLNPHLAGNTPTSAPQARQAAPVPKTAPAAPKPEKSPLEALFDDLWAQAGGPPMKTEWRFHQQRGWRLDRALPDRRFAIELEGLCIGKGGRHQRKAGFEEDATKYLEAYFEGWVVLRLTRKQLTPENIAKIVLATANACAKTDGV